MQVVADDDAANNFKSLDNTYYFGGQLVHEQVAVKAHQPQDQSEIELKMGDILTESGNHWNGYSKGKNIRTNKSGLYPSYKVEENWRTYDFLHVTSEKH